VVVVNGRLDAVTAGEFDKESDSWVSGGKLHIIADLSELEYISSAGLRSILTSAKKLKSAQGSIAFCGLNGMVEEVFSVSGFSAMFPIHQNIDDALAG